jgi:hypothetical protein
MAVDVVAAMARVPRLAGLAGSRSRPWVSGRRGGRHGPPPVGVCETLASACLIRGRFAKEEQ